MKRLANHLLNEDRKKALESSISKEESLDLVIPEFIIIPKDNDLIFFHLCNLSVKYSPANP